MSYFLNTLDLKWIGGVKGYRLTNDFAYYSNILGRYIEVPVGYKTDFASVPRVFWRIFPPHGKYVPASVVHDYLCDLRGSTGVDSKTTHAIFNEAMEVVGVAKWKRVSMYNAVRFFGPKFKSKIL